MYKKLLVLLVCLFFCSCGANIESNIEHFFGQKTVRFEYMETEYEYNAANGTFYYLNGDYEGMQVLFDESGCIITYREFSLQAQAIDIPHLNALHKLYLSFKTSADSAVVTDDGAYALLIDSRRFLVYYNKDTERIDKLIAETESGVFEYTVLMSEETD